MFLFHKDFVLFTLPRASNRSEGGLIQVQLPLEGWGGGSLEQGWARWGGVSSAGLLPL